MPVSPETWRCFVAVPVPPDLRRSLDAVVTAWRAEPDAPNLRWTDPGGWHVTLAFLGATDPASVPGLADDLEATVAPFGPFAVSTGRAGAFPRPGAAQSVWLGIADPDDRLRELAAAVQGAVLSPDRRRPLKAHLTLGRSRVRRGEPLGPWLGSRAFPATALAVEDVVLYRSHLGRGPARYSELARLPLGGAGSAGG
jgi:2'-5' RNA ligase